MRISEKVLVSAALENIDFLSPNSAIEWKIIFEIDQKIMFKKFFVRRSDYITIAWKWYEIKKIITIDSS